jgi:hypothetical protein
MQDHSYDEDGGAACITRRFGSSASWIRAALTVAGPMKLVCLHSTNVTADLVRSRLHGRPWVTRARATNDT